MKGFILSEVETEQQAVVTVKEQHAVLLIMSVCVFKETPRCDHQLNYKIL